MGTSRDSILTQQFSTWGDKLLNHADVLHAAQVQREWRVINIQLAPTEICDSDCPFCSVSKRPRSVMPWRSLRQCLADFKALGARAVEITGGGNPLLYRNEGFTINDIVLAAADFGYDIGIITNSHSFKRLDPAVYPYIHWIRVSLIQLDEGVPPEDYDFNGFPEDRMGFSYIIYDASTPMLFRLDRIMRLVSLHPQVKFLRVAGDCLIKGNNVVVHQQWREAFDQADTLRKVFFKTIQEGDDDPFDDGCYVGMVRPYIAADPEGDGYNVYTCSSHVLNKRTYDRAYALCRVENVTTAWAAMNERFKTQGFPYEVKGNAGKGWCQTCRYCYYKNNNRLLYTVCHDLPEKNFA